MEFSLVVAVVLMCALCLDLAQGDVGAALQQRRLQQQSAAYPASGYRPAQQFELPAQNLEQIAQPAATYGAPARLRQPIKPAKLSAAVSERLMANSEAQEDLDDAAEEVQLPQAMAAAQPAAQPPAVANAAAVPFAVPAQPTIAYYPAGAISFVQPPTYPKLITAPQATTAAYVNAAAYAQPQYYAAFQAPLYG